MAKKMTFEERAARHGDFKPQILLGDEVMEAKLAQLHPDLRSVGRALLVNEAFAEFDGLVELYPAPTDQ